MDNTLSKNDTSLVKIDPTHFPIPDEVIQKMTKVAPMVNAILIQNGYHGNRLDKIEEFQSYLRTVNEFIEIRKKELDDSRIQKILYFFSKRYDPKIAQTQYITATLNHLRSADLDMYFWLYFYLSIYNRNS